MKIRGKYINKCNLGGKIQVLMYSFENVIKIAAVTSKMYIESRVRTKNERLKKF